MKKILYVDMVNVLVNFKSGIDKLDIKNLDLPNKINKAITNC